jgi:hypothetical protein
MNTRHAFFSPRDFDRSERIAALKAKAWLAVRILAHACALSILALVTYATHCL